ncbi:MAG: DUF4249 domain-containing protein [Duncaniella sp.]|nr:DUF4249 domain-containing protein [Duncaniella sp.]
MRFTYITILLSLLSAVFTSCEKELDFNYHTIPPITVIEGVLIPDGIRVGITLTTPMDEPMNLSRLTDATVSLVDMTTGETHELAADDNGYYTAHIAGTEGHDYRLAVERDRCSYNAETEMYGPVDILSAEFNWIKMPYDHVAVFQCKFADATPDKGDCYWVKLYRNGKIYRWTQTDDRGAVDGICSYTVMTTRMDIDEEEDDDLLLDGDVVTCEVSRISKAMYDYLEALQNDSNGPAMFTGDKCLGYFIATTPVEKSIVFRPDEIPYY